MSACWRRWMLVGALLPLAAAGQARAADADPWFGHDKLLHFEISTAIAAGGYGAAALLSDDVRIRLAAGGALALGAGAAKELWDLSGRGDPSLRDLTWDVVGTATGLAVALVIDWAASRLTARRAPATAR